MGVISTLGLSNILKMRKAHNIALKYVQGYAVSSCLCALSKTDMLDDFQRMGSIDIKSYAKNKNLDEEVLTSICEYLYCTKILDKNKNNYQFSRMGKFIFKYTMGPFSFINAYSQVFTELEFLLKKQKKYGVEIHKDGKWVAKASAETENWIPYPIIKKVLRQYNFKRIIDLGCGGAEFLIKLCNDNQELLGYGVDISASALKYAEAKISEHKLQKRIQLIYEDILNVNAFAKIKPQKVDVIISMFVLHEFIDKNDNQNTKIVAMLKNLKKHFPNSWLIVCELCKKKPELLRKRESLIAEHHLFHALSNQRIVTEGD
ncbi:MAG: class I SAM-dependent methyltransferase, partial [Candidatus Omnitrophica bacterium]|nr:class I SAM-dependent methyltransferase [Candidatus Omnitrophota bacterium]